MKVLKILLSLLGLILVVFFGAGLVSPSVNYKVQTTVDLPVEQTFTLFNDESLLREWMPDVKSIEAEEEKPGKVGSRYKIIVDNAGEDFEITETITEWKDNELIALHYDAGNMIKTSKMEFLGENGKTTVRNTSSCRGSNYIHRCMFAFFKGMFKKIDQTYLDNFREVAESQG